MDSVGIKFGSFVKLNNALGFTLVFLIYFVSNKIPIIRELFITRVLLFNVTDKISS